MDDDTNTRDGKVLDIKDRLTGERKPWRSRYPECYAARIDDIVEHHRQVKQLITNLGTIQHELAEIKAFEVRGFDRADLADAIVLLRCAEEKLGYVLPIEMFMSPDDLATVK